MDSNTENRRAKRDLVVAVIGVCLFIAISFALLALPQLPFVYYRHFNRIKAQLEVLPETKIIASWQHEDITLEDFGFDLKVRQCPPIRIDFYEGGDWYRDFGVIDGIIFSKPYNPATNDYETTRISCDELADAGVRVRSLKDIITQLEAVLAYLKTRPQKATGTPRAGAYYIRIYFDLDAYTQKHAA